MKKIKIFISVCCCFLCVLLLVLILFSGKNGELHIYSSKGADYKVLIPLNTPAKKMIVEKNKTAFYKFSESQKNLFRQTYYDSGNVSFTLRIAVVFPKNRKIEKYINAESLPFSFGFLNSSDFTERGKLVFNEQNHAVVSGDFKDILDVNENEKTFDVSFSFPIDKSTGKIDEREGFFIKSSVPCYLISGCAGPSVIGFDKETEVPYWGFSSNGGKLSFNSSSFDFTGASLVFTSKSSETSVPPEILFSIDDSLGNEKFSFSFGGERFNFSRVERIAVSALAFKNPFSFMEPVNNQNNVKSVLMKKGDSSIMTGYTKDKIIYPVKTDPGLILDWPVNNWRCRNYELFEWDRFPGILFFDTKNYKVQSSFFARLAFYVEKEGYKGKILTNEELQGKHDFNAHDYSTESLARFFNEVEKKSFKLNPEEEVLLEILLSNHLLEYSGDKNKPYTANPGAVLSVSREIPSYNRKSLLSHEGWHTLFFTDEEFRNYVAAVYNTMDSKTLNFLIDYFKSQSSLGYDTNDEYLMHNEFMAYLLQQPVSKTGEYFVNKAGWGSVKKYTPDLCNFIIETKGQGFEDCAIMLEDFIFDKYNLKAGNLGLCSY
ncbi:MAG: hypothetical protein HUK25_05785 [Treponema sp.]|nr:hypothetical protein [Treponema sp.]